MAKKSVKFFVILNNEKMVFTCKDKSNKSFIPIFEEDKEEMVKEFILQNNLENCVSVAFSSYFLIAKFTNYSFVENSKEWPTGYKTEFVKLE